MKYIICVSKAGYLPDNNPYVVDDLNEAIQALRGEIERTDNPDDKSLDDAYTQALSETYGLSEEGGSIEYNGYIHDAIPVE